MRGWTSYGTADRPGSAPGHRVGRRRRRHAAPADPRADPPRHPRTPDRPRRPPAILPPAGRRTRLRPRHRADGDRPARGRGLSHPPARLRRLRRDGPARPDARHTRLGRRPPTRPGRPAGLARANPRRAGPGGRHRRLQRPNRLPPRPAGPDGLPVPAMGEVPGTGLAQTRLADGRRATPVRPPGLAPGHRRLSRRRPRLHLHARRRGGHRRRAPKRLPLRPHGPRRRGPCVDRGTRLSRHGRGPGRLGRARRPGPRRRIRLPAGRRLRHGARCPPGDRRRIAPLPVRHRAQPAAPPRPAALGRTDPRLDHRGRFRRRIPLCRPPAGAPARLGPGRPRRLSRQLLQAALPRTPPQLHRRAGRPGAGRRGHHVGPVHPRPPCSARAPWRASSRRAT